MLEGKKPLVLPEEFTDPNWTAILCVSPWSCNYRYALDNLADPMHGSYLHANSFTLAFGAKQDAIETYLKVAQFYGEQGFYLKAVAVYKQILKIEPRLVDVNLKLAEVYRQLRDSGATGTPAYVPSVGEARPGLEAEIDMDEIE